MAAVSGTRLAFSWIQETFWFVFLIAQLPFLILPRWVSPGRRKERVLILTDHGCSILFYFRLRRELQKKGFPVVVLSTGQFGSLQSQARRLSRALESLNVTGGILVAHGKGGLAALALPDSGRRRIQHLLTLGTSFHGSRFFLPFQFLPAFNDMTVGSEFLLLHRMNALLFPQFSPFCAYQDQYIYPSNLAYFGQGRDLILDRGGHWNLVLDPENVETVVQHISHSHPEPVTAPIVNAQPAPQITPQTPAAKKAISKTSKKKKPPKKSSRAR